MAIWIPSRLYELLPYVYMAVGLVVLVAAFVFERVPHGLFMLLGGLFLTLGLVLWMRRRDYRQSHAQYDSSSLDE